MFEEKVILLKKISLNWILNWTLLCAWKTQEMLSLSRKSRFYIISRGDPENSCPLCRLHLLFLFAFIIFLSFILLCSFPNISYLRIFHFQEYSIFQNIPYSKIFHLLKYAMSQNMEERFCDL